jgi:hypothetical protein
MSSVILLSGAANAVVLTVAHFIYGWALIPISDQSPPHGGFSLDSMVSLFSTSIRDGIWFVVANAATSRCIAVGSVAHVTRPT